MSRTPGWIARILLFVLLLLSAALPLPAQITGDIEGKITDMSGAPLPGVTVEATSPKMQGIRIEMSGRDGKYRVLAVPPGKYRIKASLQGFETRRGVGHGFPRRDGDSRSEVEGRSFAKPSS